MITITTIIMSKCSKKVLKGFSFLLLAIMKLEIPKRMIASLMFISIASFRGKIKTATMNIAAVRNLNMNVENVLCQTSFLFFPAYSSETCMPRASESESAIAIVRIPPRTASLELVAAYNPIIRPRVVIISEVIPNPKPFFVEVFILMNCK